MTEMAKPRLLAPLRHGLPAGRKLLGVLLVALLLAVGLSVLQDYLQAVRRGGAFYLSESLLFKSVWLFFLPILMLIGRQLQEGSARTLWSKARMVLLATLIHLILVPPTVWVLSSLFHPHSYGLWKVFTFTMSHDLIFIVSIYALFVGVIGQSQAYAKRPSSNNKAPPKFIDVTVGRTLHRIALDDILYVKSATPYVAIQVGDKEYLHGATMASIGKGLGPRFIRIHRSTRVNIDKVLSYKSRLNGDYDLQLVDGSEVRLSRNYAAKFKDRFGSGPRLTP